MLKVPHGRPLKPTEELREEVSADTVAGVEARTSVAVEDVAGTNGKIWCENSP